MDSGYNSSSASKTVIFETDGEASFYVPSNSFRYKQPEVPTHFFQAELNDIMSDTATSKIIALDLAAAMEIDYPATTPNLLARYIRISPSGRETLKVNAACEIYYVIRGSGTSTSGEASFEWKTDDVFMFPGGLEVAHQACSEGALLLQLTDEPVLSFAGLVAPSHSDAVVKAAYFSAEGIKKYLQVAYDRPEDSDETAKTVVLVTKQTEKLRTTTPWITTNVNTLPSGADQRAHRHNSAALTLVIDGDDVHSKIEGVDVPWQKFGVMVTPPQALHSHHNRGPNMMRSFVMQDSGIYYYSRTVGFRFDD